MPSDLRQPFGRRGERAAVAHLERLGYRILARNYRTPWGELDVVAARPDVLVFCEVKTRRAGSGRPWDALGPRKQRRVRRMAAAWLAAERERPRAARIRLDAIGVTVDAQDRLVALEHLEGAF